jgi:hypothetical protein
VEVATVMNRQYEAKRAISPYFIDFMLLFPSLTLHVKTLRVILSWIDCSRFREASHSFVAPLIVSSLPRENDAGSPFVCLTVTLKLTVTNMMCLHVNKVTVNCKKLF